MVCGNFAKEAQAVISSGSSNGVELAVFPACCGRPLEPKGISEAVQASENGFTDIHLLGGSCISELKGSDISKHCHVHAPGLCFYSLLHRRIVDNHVADGAYLLTPGWLTHWRKNLDELGFTAETAGPFFRESASRLVLLDTGIDPESYQKLVTFADCLGLPFQVEPVGLDLFRLFLEKIVLEWRLDCQSNSSFASSPMNNPGPADYAMVLDLIQHLARVYNETEIIDKTIELFTLLCAPGRVAYLSIMDGKPVDTRFVMVPAQDDEPTRARLANFSEDYGWTESGNGFILKVAGPSGTLGVLEIDHLAFPQYKEHYLDLAVSTAGVCGLAISNARTYQKLTQSRNELRITLSSIGDAVIATDASGFITFLNPVGAKLTGWQSEEAIGKPIQSVFRIINEKTRKPAENIVERVLREGRTVNLANNTALIARDQREIPVEDSAAPIKDEAGNLIGVVLVFRDVTEKRRAEEELRRAKEEWERTFDSVPDLIAILDDQHRVVRANPAMAQRLGLTPDECVGVPCYKAVHGMDEPPKFCPHARTLEDGREHTSEVHEERLGGHFLVSTTPVFNDEGRITGSVHVARDITERKRMEDELRLSRDELELRVAESTAELQMTNRALKEYAVKLERLNEELRDFAFIASHDLQEPIRKIQAFGDMLKKRCGSSLNQQGQDCVMRMAKSAKQMQSLIQALLDYSRLDSPVRALRTD